MTGRYTVFYIFCQCYSLYYYLFHIINTNICGMPLSINISYTKSEIKFLLNEWNGKFTSKAHFTFTNGYCRWASSVPPQYCEPVPITNSKIFSRRDILSKWLQYSISYILNHTERNKLTQQTYLSCFSAYSNIFIRRTRSFFKFSCPFLSPWRKAILA